MGFYYHTFDAFHTWKKVCAGPCIVQTACGTFKTIKSQFYIPTFIHKVTCIVHCPQLKTHSTLPVTHHIKSLILLYFINFWHTSLKWTLIVQERLISLNRSIIDNNKDKFCSCHMFGGGLSDVHLIKSVSVTVQKQSSLHLIILFTSSLIVIASVWNPPGCTWLFIVFLLGSFVFQERHVSSKVKLLGEGRKCSYHRRGKLLFFQHRRRITASLVADAPHPHRYKPQKPFYLLSFIHC